jgi:hypothetical protein
MNCHFRHNVVVKSKQTLTLLYGSGRKVDGGRKDMLYYTTSCIFFFFFFY